jgi:hypothetical protein
MSRLEEVAERDGWRCWLCDEPVDRTMTDDRGPSVDAVTTAAKAKAKGAVAQERLAHKRCNTKKGAVTPVVSWPAQLFVVDPAVIINSVDRLSRKGGKEIMARCPTQRDGDDAAAWLADRLTRLRPDIEFTTEVESGGGQYLLVLRAR